MAHNHLHLQEIEVDNQNSAQGGKVRKVSMALIATLAGGVLLVNSLVCEWVSMLFPTIYGIDNPVIELSAMAGALLLGLPIVIHAAKSVLKGSMHMDELVALAIIAAFATGNYREAGVVSFFMLLSELMETRTALGARASIESLIKLTPKKAMRVVQAT